MGTLSNTQRLVLNSTSDDFEDLEHIYRSICLEFSADKYNRSDNKAFYWRESAEAVPLSEIIDAVRVLVDRGFLSARLPPRCYNHRGAKRLVAFVARVVSNYRHGKKGVVCGDCGS